jgi:predicted metal-dependent hydrolase
MIEYVILHELTHTVEFESQPPSFGKTQCFLCEDAKMLDKKLRYNLPNSYAYFFEH